MVARVPERGRVGGDEVHDRPGHDGEPAVPVRRGRRADRRAVRVARADGRGAGGSTSRARGSGRTWSARRGTSPRRCRGADGGWSRVGGSGAPLRSDPAGLTPGRTPSGRRPPAGTPRSRSRCPRTPAPPGAMFSGLPSRFTSVALIACRAPPPAGPAAASPGRAGRSSPAPAGCGCPAPPPGTGSASSPPPCDGKYAA